MFKFSIRDVFWLTVVVACAVAWWLDHKRLHSNLKATGVEAMRAKQLETEIKEITSQLQEEAMRTKHLQAEDKEISSQLKELDLIIAWRANGLPRIVPAGQGPVKPSSTSDDFDAP